MKKIISALITCVLVVFCIAFIGCANANDGTYYPPNEQMQTNLEERGYTVSINSSLTDQSGNSHGGTLLRASKNQQSEYIYFYRLENSNSCEFFYNWLEVNCKDYNTLVKLENDEEFGNIVFCGTKDAVDSAGIIIVNVNVKV